MSEDSYSYPLKASSGGPKNVIRKVNGKAVKSEITEAEMAAYTPPPDGQYHLKVIGFYEPWEKAKKAEWIKPGGPTTTLTTRLECEVMEGKGKGRRFASEVSCTVGASSNLGKVWLAAVGPIPLGVELTDILDTEFKIFVSRNEDVDQNGNKKVYANPTWSTAKPVGEESDADDEGWPAA